MEELAEIFKGALSWSELEQVCARIDENRDGHVTVEELESFLFQSISDEDLTQLGVQQFLWTISRNYSSSKNSAKRNIKRSI